jgi:hypothetical protein
MEMIAPPLIDLDERNPLKSLALHFGSGDMEEKLIPIFAVQICMRL